MKIKCPTAATSAHYKTENVNTSVQFIDVYCIMKWSFQFSWLCQMSLVPVLPFILSDYSILLEQPRKQPKQLTQSPIELTCTCVHIFQHTCSLLLIKCYSNKYKTDIKFSINGFEIQCLLLLLLKSYPYRWSICT